MESIVRLANQHLSCVEATVISRAIHILVQEGAIVFVDGERPKDVSRGTRIPPISDNRTGR